MSFRSEDQKGTSPQSLSMPFLTSKSPSKTGPKSSRRLVNGEIDTQTLSSRSMIFLRPSRASQMLTSFVSFSTTGTMRTALESSGRSPPLYGPVRDCSLWMPSCRSLVKGLCRVSDGCDGVILGCTRSSPPRREVWLKCAGWWKIVTVGYGLRNCILRLGAMLVCSVGSASNYNTALVLVELGSSIRAELGIQGPPALLGNQHTSSNEM